MPRNEIGASICRRPNGTFVFGPFATGTPTSVNVPIKCPPGSRFHGIYHTHPGGVPIPSRQDIKSGQITGSKTLCINADGRVRCWNPNGR